ncbi:MAG: hypothetical protein JXA21_26640 [Anaerolineae bacterium]|nr:hypothetical protein [Anaerolineae bacterium]
MLWQYTAYLIATFLGAAITTYLTAYAWRRRFVPGATAFSISMGLATWLSLVTVLSLLGPTVAFAGFWFRLMFISLAGMPVAWLVFTYQYTGGKRPMTPLKLLGLCLIPLLTQVLLWTNDFHHLMMIHPGEFLHIGPFFVADRSTAVLGPWFWIYTAYGYGVTMWSAFFVVRAGFRGLRLYLGQAALLLFGVFFPVLATAVTTFFVNSPLKVNLAPLGFTLGGIVFALAVFRFRLFDVAPVARDVLVDRMSDGMLVLDAQDRIVDLNPVFQAISGIDSSQGIGLPVDVGVDWPALITCLKDPAHAPFEITLNAHEYDVRISSLHDMRGSTSGRLVVLRDITARKQTELALQQYTRELEVRNAELDAFAHTVAHDLKDPLSVLVGFGMLLENYFEAMPPETVHRNLQHIVQTGQKMTDIVNELLLLASIRKLEDLEVGPLDMASIVNEVCSRLAPMIAERGAVLVKPRDWPEVIGYAPWIEEVWVNYIANALRYGGRPAEGVSPHVELGWDHEIPFCHKHQKMAEGIAPPVPAASPTHYVRFWVRDNGHGLTEEEQARLFKLFTQIGASRSAAGGNVGHGLGLSIVQRIIYKLSGEVGVESVVDQGSTFWFTLFTDEAG